MTMKNDSVNTLLSAIQAADSVLLFSHIAPDGDTLGSTLALKLLLRRLGKTVETVMDGEVPANLAFLPECGAYLQPADAKPASLSIAVDVSCDERLGSANALFHQSAATAVIDHHGTNEGFAAVNWIDGDAPATGILIFRLYQALGISILPEEAVCLYTALATDTGNFVYQSVNAEAFEMMAALMGAGLPLAEYSRILFRQKEEGFVRLLGQALPSLRVADGMAGLRVSLAQLKTINVSPSETDGVVNYAIDLKGIKMAYFIHENEIGAMKVSLRALAPYRIDRVAAEFNGGGHQLAAGCTLNMPMEKAVETIESALISALKEQSAQ